MPGFAGQIDRRANSVTETVALSMGGGGHRTATFLWQTASHSGTWDIAFYSKIGGIDVKIAELTGVTTAGTRRVPLTADFASNKMAIPTPDRIVYTEAVAGNILTSRVWAIFGD